MDRYNQTSIVEDFVVFKKARGDAKRAVREAKNRWF